LARCWTSAQASQVAESANRTRGKALFSRAIASARLTGNRGPATKLSPKTRNGLVFFLALFLLTVGALLTYRTVFRLLDAQSWVSHSHQVQSALANITVVIGRAGRDRVEYVQAGDPARLVAYHASAREATQAVALVQRLTSDNPLQADNCNHLKSLTAQRIAAMGQSVTLKQSGQSTLEKDAEITQSIVHLAAEMDSVILQMQRVEEELLAERQIRSQALFRLQIVLFSAAFLLAVVLLSLHYYLLTRELEARQRAEDSLRRLNARLLETQDAERRKISRGLHESIGQYLSGVKMSLEVVRKSIPQNALLAECVSVLDKSISETRAMSQLLHPPLLDEIGFASAATWYAEDFAERNRIAVEMKLPKHLGRLPSAIELALFRLLQESLTSIHQRAEKAKIEVAVRVAANEVEMRVKANGGGMKNTAESGEDGNMGLGMEGMKERIRDMGGSFEVQPSDTGTLMIAVLPLADSRPQATPDGDRQAEMR
jgi:signal transduction histidine kinase